MKKSGWLALSLALLFIVAAFSVFGVEFTDITLEAGVGDRGQAKGAAWADIDNDGDLDLYLSNKGGANRLFRNDGDGKFTDITDKAGVGDTGFCMGSVFGDINNDGHIDLYVPKGGRYEIEANRLFLNKGDGTFSDISKEAGVDSREFTYAATMADYDNDGDLDIYCANYGVGAKNILYRNDGDLTFSDVSKEAGVGDRSWSWGATFSDIDNDGDLDLYVINGRYPAGEPNKLYRNNSDGTFTDVSKEAGVDDNNWGLGACFADIDNDGDFDLFLSNYVGPNRLFINDGSGHFSDNAAAANLADEGWGKGPTFADIDHDGDLDFYEGDCKVANQLYENDGKGVFKNITEVNPALECATVRSKASTFTDIDNDGDLDLYVVNWSARNRLFRNEQNDQRWLGVKLVGSESNRSAVGAKVKVYDHGHIDEVNHFRGIREVVTATGFCAMPGLPVHFGLASGRTYDVVAIFPNGRKVIEEDVKPGQYIKIVEPLRTTSRDKVPTTILLGSINNLTK